MIKVSESRDTANKHDDDVAFNCRSRVCSKSEPQYQVGQPSERSLDAMYLKPK